MRSIRLRTGVLAAIVVAAGLSTVARADDWPAPTGDPFLGNGVIVADVANPSGGGGIGLRITLPTGGPLDLLSWVDTGPNGSKPDEKIAVGGRLWNVLTPPPARRPSGFSFNTDSGGPDLYAAYDDAPVVDVRSGTSRNYLGVGFGTSVPAGTYVVAVWGTTDSSSATSRFRVHAPADATIVDQTSSTTTFLRAQREFTGTANVLVNEVSVSPVGPIGVGAALDLSTSVDISAGLFGEFWAPPNVSPFGIAPAPNGSYDGPDGHHVVPGQAWITAEPAGSYTFHIDHAVYYDLGDEAYVGGVDLAVP